MQDISDHIENRKAQIKDLKERTIQAKSDKVELYRDISTFECNYAGLNKREIFKNIDDLTEKIVTQKEALAEATKQEPGMRSWLTQEQQTDIFETMKEVRRIQRKKTNY